MTKIKFDYSKACIYKIVCRDPEIKDCYVGSTTNLIKRRSQHKCACNSENSKGYNRYKYQFIRENGGFDNWQVLEIEKVDCKSKEELLRRERYYVEKLHASLNKNIPNRTKKESDLIRQIPRKCECGGSFSDKHKTRHYITKMHINFVKSKSCI